jgi:hypothetical protein
MIDVIHGAIGEAQDRAVVFGSSLGGLSAARAAEMAERWPARIGDEAFRGWEARGWLEVHDHTTGRPARMHVDFIRDAEC